MPELVANTRCTIHGVPDVLRIYLQGEFILDSLTSETPLLAASQCHAQRSPSRARARVNACVIVARWKETLKLMFVPYSHLMLILHI